MTRINTNVSSLIAQNTLSRNNNDLSQSLTRLSTGLRINSGADDPAGLIASENLRRDITGIERAVSNSERAGQLIATADSALGQVSNLLNDIRGLVTEAASTGALSDEQIAANQLQVDSSLEAIDRISQVTTFQGRKLLDGTLDFAITEGADYDKLSNIQIGQANLGTTGAVAVEVGIQTAATQAQVDVTNVPAATTAANAFDDLQVSNSIVQATQGYTLLSGGSFSVTGVAGQATDGDDGNDYNIELIQGADGINLNGTTLEVTTDLTSATALSIAALINADAAFASVETNAGASAAGDVGAKANLAGGRDAGSADIRVTANTAGVAANGITVTLIESATPAAGDAIAQLNGANIEVLVNNTGPVSYATIADAIGTDLTDYSAALLNTTGNQNYVAGDTATAATLANGADAAGGLAQDVVFELAGQNGREVFSFQAGATITQLETAINALSDSTGAVATVNGTTLEVTSSGYGSNSLVEISVVSEAAGGTITAAVGNLSRDNGDDVVATINGIRATGDGNSLSLNTSVLDLGLELQAGYTGTANFTIAGGGAKFQLGPQVVTNQQARLGIGSVSTARLGGSTGRLYELRAGESSSLANDANGAARIVDDVITKIVELRGRLGAFQRTTLQSNISSLTDTLSSLTAAESSIRDADFAVESAQLTRAQILVQSSTSVLAIANQNPQNALALLR